MPSGTRIRSNNQFGLVDDNPLTIGATTLNSSGLSSFPAVSSAHSVITLDPLKEHGSPEIVVITSHAALGTAATITRGQYGTSARVHPMGTTWVHAPITEDVTDIVTSATRPSNPYEGQEIYETDTNAFTGYDGASWEHILTLGAWTSWTPTLTNFTVGTGSTLDADYIKIGRGVWWRFHFIFGTGGALTGIPTFSLPVTAATGVSANLGAPGVAIFDDATNGMFWGGYEYATTTIVRFLTMVVSGANVTRNFPGAAAPFTWTTSDKIRASGFYQSAA